MEKVLLFKVKKSVLPLNPSLLREKGILSNYNQ